MVFPSIPYLDPSNWQQQQPNQQANITNTSSSQLLIPPVSVPPPPPPPPPQPHGGGGAGSIRPGSMTERARLANIPMPEAALKCPRCESTNTKFCYFNNYSLSQPRHFCKTCRRYWTRGGSLRNVPVGGGCRRNKRSKGTSSSKSPATSSHDGPAGSGSSSSVSSGTNIDILGLGGGGGAHQHLSQLRFMSPALQHLTHDQFSSGDHFGLSSYGGSLQSSDHHHHLNFQVGSSNTLANVGTLFGGNSLLSIGGANLDQTWRIHQGHHPFPFIGGGLDTSSGSGSGSGSVLYPFEGGSEPSGYGNVRPKISTSGLSTQLASVKMEDNNNNNNQEISMSSSRHFLGLQGNEQQYWNAATGTTNAWTDLSNFSSSSTSNNQL